MNLQRKGEKYMSSTIVVSILGGIILVGFFAYNIYDNYLKKDRTNEENTSKKA